MIKLSWSNLELFNECPRCFYFEVRYKVRRPSGFPLNFNNAIDRMMKDEMDMLRSKDVKLHPIEISGKEFVLSLNNGLGKWRQSGFVDFKSTARYKVMDTLPRWSDKIKRQLSFYAYLLTQLGYGVSDDSVIFYVVGKIKKDGLSKKMEFGYQKFIVKNDTAWINPTVQRALDALKSNDAPQSSERCIYCKFEERSRRVSNSIDTPDTL